MICEHNMSRNMYARFVVLFSLWSLYIYFSLWNDIIHSPILFRVASLALSYDLPQCQISDPEGYICICVKLVATNGVACTR